MKKHLNTLFVTTLGAYLSKEGETVLVKHGNRRGFKGHQEKEITLDTEENSLIFPPTKKALSIIQSNCSESE
jgi:hypothetical protein